MNEFGGKTFGDRLLRCLKRAGLTRYQFAHVAGVPTAWVNEWCDDLTVPTEATIDQMAKVLVVDRHYLATGRVRGCPPETEAMLAQINAADAAIVRSTLEILPEE